MTQRDESASLDYAELRELARQSRQNGGFLRSHGPEGSRILLGPPDERSLAGEEAIVFLLALKDLLQDDLRGVWQSLWDHGLPQGLNLTPAQSIDYLMGVKGRGR